MTEVESVLQRILDEQGYIVLSCPKPRVIGELVERSAGPVGVCEHTLVVIGFATAQDWVRQQERFFPGTRYERSPKHLHKVVAE